MTKWRECYRILFINNTMTVKRRVDRLGSFREPVMVKFRYGRMIEEHLGVADRKLTERVDSAVTSALEK